MNNQTYADRIRVKLKMFDDCFHVLLIAMERMETYLELEKNGAMKSSFKITAIKTDRDLHDDNANIPTRKAFFSETQLDCCSLFFQVDDFKDENEYKKIVEFFLTDLLEWYGGRCNVEYFNEVDAFALPILAVLGKLVDGPKKIQDIVEKYIIHIPKIYEQSEEEQLHSVEEGMKAFLLATDKVNEDMAAFMAMEVDAELTSHQRGTVIDGYKRLYEAFTTLYTETLPAKTLVRVVADFLPAVLNSCPDLNEDNVEKFVEKHKKQEPVKNEDGEEVKQEKSSVIDSFVNLFKK